MAKDHWRGFSTQYAYSPSRKVIPIKNGVYILVEVSVLIDYKYLSKVIVNF